MKTGIHPAYQTITVACACGNNFEIGSTLANNLRVEICAKCHPLYTGKSKLIDTAGRVDKFQARLRVAEAAKAAKAGSTPAAAVEVKEEAAPEVIEEVVETPAAEVEVEATEETAE